MREKKEKTPRELGPTASSMIVDFVLLVFVIAIAAFVFGVVL